MEKIKFRNKEYEIIKNFKNNKLLVKHQNKNYIIVPFDTYNAYSNYLANKKILKKNKVEMNKVLKKDSKALLVLEEYIEDGIPLINLLADNEFDDKKYTELFRIYRNNRFAKIALNYKPENFIFKKKYFYYISDDVFKINEVIPFERSDDLHLYMSTNSQKRYIESFGLTYNERRILKEGGELNKAIALLCVTYW